MRPLVLVLVCLLPACAYDPSSGKWFPIRTNPDDINFGGPNDTTPIERRLDENLRVQRYMREHNGKMPPENEFLPP